MVRMRRQRGPPLGADGAAQLLFDAGLVRDTVWHGVTQAMLNDTVYSGTASAAITVTLVVNITFTEVQAAVAYSVAEYVARGAAVGPYAARLTLELAPNNISLVDGLQLLAYGAPGSAGCVYDGQNMSVSCAATGGGLGTGNNATWVVELYAEPSFISTAARCWRVCM